MISTIYYAIYSFTYDVTKPFDKSFFTIYHAHSCNAVLHVCNQAITNLKEPGICCSTNQGDECGSLERCVDRRDWGGPAIVKPYMSSRRESSRSRLANRESSAAPLPPLLPLPHPRTVVVLAFLVLFHPPLGLGFLLRGGRDGGSLNVRARWASTRSQTKASRSSGRWWGRISRTWTSSVLSTWPTATYRPPST